MNKRDILLLLGAVLIVGILWLAPEETTKRVPDNDIHQRMYATFKSEGKKAAGKLCQECHNADDAPLPEGHPPQYRCLFCHKLQPQ